MKNDIKALNSQVEILTGRLLRSEAHCRRLENDLTDMKAHSMGKNIIIHSKDNKEMQNENCVDLARNFFEKDMKMKNAKQIKISVAHRLGAKRSDGKPRPIIVTIHDSGDFGLIMKSTPNLKGSGKFIEKQLPASMQERRQCVVPKFKEAKKSGDRAIIKNDRLFINGQLQREFLPPNLPEGVKSCVSFDHLPIKFGSTISDGGSDFCGYAAEVNCLDDVRSVADLLLRDRSVASKTHFIYAYVLDDSCNFDSDGDYGIGSGLLKHMQKEKLVNQMFIVTRDCGPQFNHIGYKRIENSIKTCMEAYESDNYIR